MRRCFFGRWNSLLVSECGDITSFIKAHVFCIMWRKTTVWVPQGSIWWDYFKSSIYINIIYIYIYIYIYIWFVNNILKQACALIRTQLNGSKYCYITVTIWHVISLHTFYSIWPIGKTLSGATIPDQSEPWSSEGYSTFSNFPRLELCHHMQGTGWCGLGHL